MRPQVNLEEKTKQFNAARLQNQSGIFGYQEIQTLLKGFGISKHISAILIRNGAIDCEKVDGRPVYSFKETPLHMSAIKKAYDEYREMMYKSQGRQMADLEKAIALVRSAGIKVGKPRFDETRFKRENPELYAKYVVYDYE